MRTTATKTLDNIKEKISELKNLDIKQIKSIARRFLGFILVSLIVTSWVGSNYITIHIQTKLHYEKSFIITYINTCSFSLYLVIDCLIYLYKASRRYFYVKKQRNMSPVDYEIDGYHKTYIEPCNVSNESIVHKLVKGFRKYSISIPFCIIWLMANFPYNMSFRYLHSNIIEVCSATSVIFVLTLSVLLKLEKYSHLKLLCIGICIPGIAVVAFSKHINAQNESVNISTKGIALALVSALFYSFYSSFYRMHINKYIKKHIDYQNSMVLNNEKRPLPPPEQFNNRIFFGLVGLYNIFIGLLIIYLLHIYDFETFEWPQNTETYLYLFANAIFGSFLSDFIWLYAVTYATPFYVALGLNMMAPITLFIDTVIKHLYYSSTYYIGNYFILVSVFLVNIISKNDNDNQTIEEKEQ